MLYEKIVREKYQHRYCLMHFCTHNISTSYKNALILSDTLFSESVF